MASADRSRVEPHPLPLPTSSRLTRLYVGAAVWLVAYRLELELLGGGDLLPWDLTVGVTMALAVAIGPWALVVPLVVRPMAEGAYQSDPQWDAAAIEAVVWAVVYGGVGLVLRRRGGLGEASSRTFLRFALLGAVVAPMVGATCWALARQQVGLPVSLDLADVGAVAITHHVGVLLATPFLVVALGPDRWRNYRPTVLLERPTLDRALLVFQVGLVLATALAAPSLADSNDHPVYLAAPPLLWLAATRGWRATSVAVCALGASLTAVLAATDTVIDPRSLQLQASVLAVLALTVAALHTDRRRSIIAFRRITAELQLSEARHRTVIEHAADAILVLDAHGRIETVNAKAAELFDHDRTELTGRCITDLVPPPGGLFGDQYLTELLEARATSSRGHRYLTGRRGDGTTFPLRLSMSRAEVDGRLAHTAIVRDESDHKRFEDRLEHLATHDSLTGLPNRTLAHDRLTSALARLEREPGSVAVLLVDLDRFKEINDTLGHDTGDRVLVEAAQRLRGSVRPSDTVARLGGDEFLIVTGPIADHRVAAELATRVLVRLGEAHPGVPEYLTPSASIGVRLVSEPDASPERVLHEADEALYAAKRQGRNTYRLHSQLDADGHVPLEIDLRSSLADEELVVHYQPVFDTATATISDVEALARLPRQGGLVTAGEFVPLAERIGLAPTLGEQVLRQACRDLRRLRQEERFVDLGLAVNVSPLQLKDRRFFAQCRVILAANQLPPEALTLEITETAAFGDLDQATDTLALFADLGVRIALDDFGTGSAPLTLVRDLPVSTVKIDRSFVADVVDDPTDRDLVATIVELADRRGLRCIAEGVETIEQADALAELGCRHLQGYLFGRPMHLEAILERAGRRPSELVLDET